MDENGNSRAFTSAELAFLVAVPLLWGVLLFLHPGGDGDFYPLVSDQVVEWQVTHVGTMLFIPLMGAAIYVLLRGVTGTAAQVARLAILPFVVFYAAFEILIGVGSGIIVNEVNALPEADRAVGAQVVDGFTEHALPFVFSTLGSLALLVAMLGAGIAFLKPVTGWRRWAPLLLLALATPLIAIHEPPFGPVGLGLFIATVALLARRQPETSASLVPPVGTRALSGS